MGFIEGNVTLIDGNGNVEDVFLTAGTNITHPDVNGDYILALPAGTYDVIASLEGYDVITEYDVQIVVNQTVIINFDLTSLQAPEDLTAVANSNDVTLNWNVPTLRENGANIGVMNSSKAFAGNRMELEDSNSAQTVSRSLMGFRIYRNSIEIVQINDPSLTSYGDLGLDSGDYSYYVTALYDDDYESLPSNVAEVTITLDPPVNLTAQAQQPDVLLNWDAPLVFRNLTGYRIYRNDESIADVTETTYTDASLQLGIYTYYVTGLYDQYESAPSNEVNIELTSSDDPLIPTHTALIGNYPNPFNPETTISFSLSEQSSFVTLDIFNVRGQQVRTLVNEQLTSGFYTYVWDGKSDTGRSVTSGIYFYKMQNADYTRTRKMILLK